MSSAEKRPAPTSRTVLDPPHVPERTAAPAAPRKTPAPPPGLAAAPDMNSLLGALRRRWLLALSLGLTLAATVTGAIWYFVPARYTTYAYVRAMLDPNGGGRDFLAFLKTQAQRMKSQKVLLDVLGDPEEVYKIRKLPLFTQMPDPHSRLTFLDEWLKVEYAETSELLKLEFVWEDPEVAVRVVDAVTRAYVKLAAAEEGKERKARVDQMSAFYNETQKYYNETYTKMKAEEKDSGSADPAEQFVRRSTQQQELTLARTKLDEASAKVAGLKLLQKKLEGRLNNVDAHIPTAEIDEVVAVHPSVKEVEAQLEYKRLKVKSMVDRHYSSNEPILLDYRRDVARLEGLLRKRKQEIRKAQVASYRQKLVFTMTEHKHQAEDEIPVWEKNVEALTARLRELKSEMVSKVKGSSKVEELKTELDGHKKTLEQVGQKLQQYQVEAKSPPRVRIEQEATWVDKDLKRRILLLAGGFLGTFFIVALGVAYVDFRGRKIHTGRELAAGLNLKVLGEVPDWPEAGRDRFIGPDEGPPGSAKPSLIEAIDGIRTLLLRGAGEQGCPVVMVTSAVEGEGKTTLASNLALSVARSGRKTLFIDCDLRRPGAHQLFEQTLQPGFGELVLGEVEIGAALRPTTTGQNLWLLPAGQWDRAVVQELARRGVGDLFAQLREEFDFIILDSHPLLPATDSLLIGQHVDGVIISVLHDVSQTPKVYAACQRLETLGIPCFGAVVNGTAGSY